MIRNWYNQFPHPALKTKREITKYINWRQFTKALAVNWMNSSFPNRWSFNYLKFTKYVTNIIAEPKYKYGQQEQLTVRKHNRSTALEQSVLKYWGGGLNRFYGNPTSPSASIMAQNIQLFSPREGFLTHQWIITGPNKSQINTMMKQSWRLDRNVLLLTPGDPWGVEQHHWNTGAKENQQLNPGGPSNRQKSSGPNQLK